MKLHIGRLATAGLLVLLLIGVAVAVPDVVSAQGGGPSPGAFKVNISPLPKTDATPTKIQAILGVIFAILGALSLLMVTIGGFRFVASQGDPQAAAKAKGTVLYAIIGLLISISAIAIISFVVRRV